MLIDRIFRKNPYEDFNEDLTFDLQGWGTNESTLNKLIDEVRPSLIVEVGTWKGASAIGMAKHVKEIGLGCEILCVDTWLGSLEHMNYPPLKNGYPQIYYQFLKNVITLSLQDIIVPFPNTSSIACQWLRKEKVTPNLVYIDGSHDGFDVYNDISEYYEIIDKGILCGDDYGWNGVGSAVEIFSDTTGIGYELLNHGVVWVIRK